MRRVLMVGISVVAMGGLLASCSSVKKEIGVGRNSPDEFAVVTRTPLTLPPEYELTPPKDESEIEAGANKIQEQAKSLMFNTDVQIVSSETSASEAALLQQAGVGEADETIRKLVDREAGQVDINDPYLGRRLLGFNSPVEKGEALDPVEEMQRFNEMQQKSPHTLKEESTHIIE